MKKLFSLIWVGLLVIGGSCKPRYNPHHVKYDAVTEQKIKQLYTQLGSYELSYPIFKKAMFGFYHLNYSKKRFITIVDFTKPASQHRFFVIDLKRRKIRYKTWVAHGKNSGNLIYATRFSNRNGSKMSSLGFYKTAETYRGKHGYSLKLDGLEKGINHRARRRYIVIHGAKYVNASYVGRSWGCPALPVHLATPIIKKIKRGSCVFIYANDRQYLAKSKYLVQ
ncbi:hypothetical protein BKI52_40925 [marine bacterium AO1-C]|nr:hypothetical protein BKI52_40925 [marine bacterium AO1-C]